MLAMQGNSMLGQASTQTSLVQAGCMPALLRLLGFLSVPVQIQVRHALGCHIESLLLYLGTMSIATSTPSTDYPSARLSKHASACFTFAQAAWLC